MSTTYTITVTNSGPSTATNVLVGDPMPTGATSETWSGNGHTNVSGALSDTIATLAPGQTVTYTVTLAIDPAATGSLTNTVTTTAANDTNPNNNTATDKDNLTPQNDVSVTKTDNVGGTSLTAAIGTVVPGASFTYTITVTNSGPSTATNVLVSDFVPAGLSSFVWNGDGRTNVSGPISDTIANLAPNASVTYTVTATVNPAATAQLNNIVTATAANDTNPNNNTAIDRDNLTPQIDLSIKKTDNVGGTFDIQTNNTTGGKAVPGLTTVTYTIVVSNGGPSTATNVPVTDLVPTGVTSFVWSGNGHSNVSGPISDSISSLGPNSSVTYTVTVQTDAKATGNLVNTAIVGSREVVEGNDISTDTIGLTPQSISGFKFEDLNRDGIWETATEPALAGWIIHLHGPNGLSKTAITDATGAYEFDGLPLGNYTLTEQVPTTTTKSVVTASANPVVIPVVDTTIFAIGEPVKINQGLPNAEIQFVTAINPGVSITVGKLGFAHAAGAVIAPSMAQTTADPSVTILEGTVSKNNNFGNAPTRQSSVSGHVYVDLNNNGTRNAGEPGIGHVKVTLYKKNGSGVFVQFGAAQFTDSTGFYNFVNLAPGTYKIVEGPVTGFRSGQNSVGTVKGKKDGVALANAITNIVLGQGQAGINYDFAKLPTKSIFFA
jgi:uncharacterized repeat protein (TIGR01451 family)